MTLSFIVTNETNPFDNLALEAFFLEQSRPDEIVLMLWQNYNTVVIGRNQNAWRECRVRLLENDGGFLARRRSGGGAVYHDMGNLNFSFIACDSDYDQAKQLEVILSAMHGLGISAEASGRNDIIFDGRKFSGNAYIRTKGRNCHHGTILVDTNKAKMERYLSVAEEKMHSKGVTSMRTRTVNLHDLSPDITIDSVRLALLESFSAVYNSQLREIDIAELPYQKLDALRSEFFSWDWRYGVDIPFTQKMAKRFAWGEIELQLQVNNGHIEAAAVFSDALVLSPFEILPTVLKGLLFKAEAIQKALSHSLQADIHTQQIITDICNLIYDEMS